MRVVQRFDEGELAGVRLALREATGDRDGVQRRGQEHAAPVPLATREKPGKEEGIPGEVALGVEADAALVDGLHDVLDGVQVRREVNIVVVLPELSLTSAPRPYPPPHRREMAHHRPQHRRQHRVLLALPGAAARPVQSQTQQTLPVDAVEAYEAREHVQRVREQREHRMVLP